MVESEQYRLNEKRFVAGDKPNKQKLTKTNKKQRTKNKSILDQHPQFGGQLVAEALPQNLEDVQNFLENAFFGDHRAREERGADKASQQHGEVQRVE